MAISNLTTPGVYVQEISTLPSSVVPVATAIPAFIGYTETGPLNTPTRVTSMVEFQQSFGGPYEEQFNVSIDSQGVVTVTPNSVTASNDLSPYTLFYHIQMFFANGGGTCYIVSIGNYDPNAATPIAKTDILTGIDKIEEVDEVTLLLVPEALNMSGLTPDNDIKAVYDAMLAQCNKLKDRFSVMDVMERGTSVQDDADNFRNLNVGANYLNYGAAYYPYLDTILSRSYLDDDVVITADSRVAPNTYASQPNNRLATVKQGIGTYNLITVGASISSGATITVSSGAVSATYTEGVDFSNTDAPDVIAAALVSLINSDPGLSPVIRAQVSSTSNDKFYIVVRQGTTSTLTSLLNVVYTGSGFTDTGNTGGTANSQDTGLYNSITSAIALKTGLTLPPAATMVGIYASVDNDRGVWKAPANVGVTNIIGPDILVTETQQGPLNVDATSGKSINVIRTFTGRGTLVWGSRTLDGNSNEWRYVPVRRLFIMAEESIKKASEFVVFEPNDANTWLRVKSMISNFLNSLWQQGALAGDKPEQAYFVKIGLGQTMTAQDILEGRLIVTIGMAAVRPAEFIILQFEHKLQEA